MLDAQYDSVFVLGDLNYRVDGELESLMENVKSNEFDQMKASD